MALVPAARSGIVPPFLKAHLHRFYGLIGATRGADAAEVEAELRQAIQAFDDFGALTARAHTQAELGQWFLTQGRTEEAKELLDQARAAYTWAPLAGSNDSTQQCKRQLCKGNNGCWSMCPVGDCIRMETLARCHEVIGPLPRRLERC